MVNFMVLRVVLPDQATLLKGLVARRPSRELLGLPLRPPRLPVRLETAHEILRAITVQLVAQAESVSLKRTAPAQDQPGPSLRHYHLPLCRRAGAWPASSSARMPACGPSNWATTIARLSRYTGERCKVTRA